MKSLPFFALLISLLNTLTAQTNGVLLPLWPEGKVPYALPHTGKESFEKTADGLLILRNVTVPGITPFAVPKARSTGAAVLICPGGGYAMEAYDHEGIQIAKKLNTWGISAFVLRYRLPDDSTMTNKKWVPLIDALQAMRYIRQHATEWHIDPHKVGVMGFSAGGHLAATVSTLYDQRTVDGFDPQEVRPDFSILIYPVITMTDPYAHTGSRMMLLGAHPVPADIQQFSPELHVTEKTPPAFLVHATDDMVAVQNSLLYTTALAGHKVPVSCHILPDGGHGYGLAPKNPKVAVWVNYWKDWLHGLGML